MKKVLLLACLINFLTISTSLFADDNSGGSGDMFTKFDGKPTARVFVNFEQGLFENNNISGFDLRRACLGYKAKLGNGLSAILDVDFGSSTKIDGEKKYATYVRNAEIQWNKDKFQLNFGMLAPKIFNYQELFWYYRYSVKSSMDEYKYGSSRDLGVVATYNFSDDLSVDASVINGEGNKNMFKVDNQLKYGLGVTLTPLKNFVFRGYGELYNRVNLEGLKNQYVMALLLGYDNGSVAVGVEYNKMWNTDYDPNAMQSIVSTYARYDFDKKHSAYARYDKYQSSNGWNGEEDAIYLGYQYKPVKYINLSPMLSYKIENEKKLPMIGMYLEIKY